MKFMGLIWIQFDNPEDCISDVHLEYPKEMHDLHNDCPLFPEKIEIKESILPNYCKEIAKKYNISVGGVKKLVPSLDNRDKDVLHY